MPALRGIGVLRGSTALAAGGGRRQNRETPNYYGTLSLMPVSVVAASGM
jgi:hypothetical protein